MDESDRSDRSRDPENEPFTIAVLPDTQIYSRDDPEIFEAQTSWIADQVENDVENAEDIRFVIHVGDVVHKPTDEQLEAADAAMDILDECGVPYGIAIGNHDYDRDGDLTEREATRYDAYFGPDRFEHAPWWGGSYSDWDAHNGYAYFSASGRDFIVLFLELFPRPEIVEWANDVLERHTDHEAILVTHGYLWHDSSRISKENRWDVTHYDELHGINGPEIWETIVEPNENVFLVLSGHVLCNGSARLTSVRDDGSVVHQILTNYQTQEKGGNGYLGLLRFHPAEDRITLDTYSPYLDEHHPETSHHYLLEYSFDE